MNDVDYMRNNALFLKKFTYPLTSIEDDLTVSVLKKRHLIVDGYEIEVNYSISDYKTYDLDIVQIKPRKFMFLPFNLVIKIGKMFLGEDHLCFAEFIHNGKKIYCWTVRRDSEALKPLGQFTSDVFEGFSFYRR